jgi:hypothetical protein
MHLSSESSSWLLRSSVARWLTLVSALVVVFLLLVAGFVAWRWHEAHLSTPSVPSAWVNINKGESDAMMFKWIITGQQVSGIYTDDDVTRSGCVVEPFAGRVDGHSISLEATFLDGSGTVTWVGTVSARQLELDGEVYSPGSPTSFAKSLVAMNYPACGPGSS